MIASNSTARTTRALAALLAALAVSVAFAAARTQDGADARARQAKFGVKQGEKKSEIKLVAERGELTKATATDDGGTRSLKRIDKLTLPCNEEDMKCETVELENGVLVGVCYCPDTQTALLLPAVQKVREAAARSSSGKNTNTNTNTNTGGGGGGVTKIGPGTLTLAGANAAQRQRCWGDEKLKLVVCPQ